VCLYILMNLRVASTLSDFIHSCHSGESKGNSDGSQWIKWRLSWKRLLWSWLNSSVIHGDQIPNHNCTHDIFIKVMVRALEDQTRKTDYAGETDFVVVRYSATSKSLPNSIRFASKVMCSRSIVCGKACEGFLCLVTVLLFYEACSPKVNLHQFIYLLNVLKISACIRRFYEVD
jgi:hypothetical protein